MIRINRRNTLLQVIALTLSLAVVSTVRGHDIWLHAERFTLGVGDTLVVHQLLGDELAVDLLHTDDTMELPVLRDMTPRFTLLSHEGTVNLLAELPDMRTQPVVKPVLSRSMDFDGLALVAMEHATIYTEFENDVFVEYLQHEALDRKEYRRHMGSRPMQGEAYARNLKLLVRVGNSSGGEVYKQVLGQKIEILLLQNPYRLDPGDDLDIQVLFDGAPLPDQLVRAYNSDASGPVTNHRARTNLDGIARIKLDRDGVWLIRLVHLFPCSGRSEVDCDDADWESYWASYSFELD
jgi:uncharacterized GH25 family protein